ETLPIAAGGLGILAGDHAKSASDLGLGFAGISLFYREGYFQQAVDANNWQTEYYTLLNPKNLPIEPVLNPKGGPMVCQVEIGMNLVSFQAWRDRKSTRLNSSHVAISYAVFCLKKKTKNHSIQATA